MSDMKLRLGFHPGNMDPVFYFNHLTQAFLRKESEE